jgi:hypothetical protein
MHLTNFAVNKNSSRFDHSPGKGEGSKRTIAKVFEQVKVLGVLDGASDAICAFARGHTITTHPPTHPPTHLLLQLHEDSVGSPAALWAAVDHLIVKVG